MNHRNIYIYIIINLESSLYIYTYITLYICVHLRMSRANGPNSAYRCCSSPNPCLLPSMFFMTASWSTYSKMWGAFTRMPIVPQTVTTKNTNNWRRSITRAMYRQSSKTWKWITELPEKVQSNILILFAIPYLL